MKACLFDMDGLLLNTEDIYTQVSNEVLAEHGKPNLPWEVKIEIQGLPGPFAAKRFLEWSKLDYTPDELFEKTSALQADKWPTAQFLPGALELLEKLKENGVPIALATSSNTTNFKRKTGHLQHGFQLFEKHVVTGDDPRVAHGRGKPHPDIYLVALDSINRERLEKGQEPIEPKECLVFEDGVIGVMAGKAAECTVVWVPHKDARPVLNDTHFEKTKGAHMFDSLEEFDPKQFGLF